MRPDQEGFWYPQVDTKKCVSCGLCQQTCPALALDWDRTQNRSVDAYAAYSLDAATRNESSSGGVFTELARYVLRQGGVVFGAALDEQLNVGHRYVETEEALSAFRGSKYVQSRIALAYRQAQRFLKQGRLVLFTGTPCQIGGLLRYLKRPYKNLITQDIVCHGVPSPDVWKAYVKFREGQAGTRAEQASFRCKTPGWRNYSLRLQYADGSQCFYAAANDPYMRSFVKDLSLRPSCYQCKFKGLHRESDITLADFWGVEHICPEMDDDKGTSLVLLHSEEGRMAFERVKECLRWCKTEIELAAVYNPSLVTAAKIPGNRGAFFARIGAEPFERVVNAVCPRRSFIKRVLDKLGRFFR